jgi:cytochrome c-type biogenesis protein
VTTLASPDFTGTVTHGSLFAAGAIAVLVGVIGFLSPCVLPLVPGYLSYVAGLSGSEGRLASQRRMLGGAALFVLGFTLVFVANGLIFGSLGGAIREHHVLLERIFGVVTIVMGLVFMGQLPWLQREFKIHRLPSSGLVGAPLLGLTFGLAWTPCLTPTLTAVYSMSLSEGTASRGAILSAFYCVGLGVPFLIVAFGFGRVSAALRFVRRHAAVVSATGGVVLILMGVLLVAGVWDHWMVQLSARFSHTGIGADV